MSTPTPIPPKDTTLAQESSMQELYDALMQEVEPELTFDAMQYLDSWYAVETDDERDVRMTRYEQAFALVHERMSTLVSTWKHDLEKIKRMVMKKKEAEEVQAEDAAMHSIDSSISDQ